MTLILKTIGAGGDYTKFEDAYSFLCGLGAWGDDYDFDIIDELTIDSWPDISLAANRVNQNQHRVRFHCSYNEARPTKPDLWKKITLTGANGKIAYTHDIGAHLTNDICDMEYLLFDHVSDNGLIILTIRTWSFADATTWSVKNCFIFGYGTLDEVGIQASAPAEYYDIEKVVLYNCYDGLLLYPSIVGSQDNPGRKKVTNCTIYHSGPHRGIEIVDVLGNNIIFKNVAVFRIGGDACWYKSAGSGDPDRFQLFNCSDSDNSIETNLTSNTIKTNCVPNVPALDNLQSVDSADLGKGFLDLILGSHTIDVTGLETFTEGSPDLGKTGIDSGLIKDIADRDIPGKDGEHSIGAYEQQYILTSTFLFPSGDRVSNGKGRDIALYLNTHDIVFDNYDLVLISGISYLAQKLKIKLLFFFKEWFLDTTKGMDFYNVLFVKNPNLNAVDNMIKITIVDTEGVLELLEYSADYTFSDRRLNVKFKVNTIYGELTFEESLKP